MSQFGAATERVPRPTTLVERIDLLERQQDDTTARISGENSSLSERISYLETVLGTGANMLAQATTKVPGNF